LTSVESGKSQGQRDLLQRLLRLSSLQPNPSTPQDLADERRGVRERSGVEGLLLSEETELVQHARDEVGKGFGAEVVRDDLSFDGTKTGDTEGDVEDTETRRADLTESL
jgi:hypothetical protein